ncbi:MAG: hypothetical protein H6729_02490 [Deltaproteobacteria bacterium]|nr:hypothetical protein [Deltaproteobacteria bacterium]
MTPLRFMKTLLLAAPFAVWFAAHPTEAEASRGVEKARCSSEQSQRSRHHRVRRPVNRREVSSRAVPELNPKAAGGALVLLVGGTLVMLGRRPRTES